VAEEQADAEVDDPVEHELDPRVAVDLGAAHEARSERAVVAGLQQAEVVEEVAGMVGAVGHHDRHGVALERDEPRAHGEAEAAAVERAQAAHVRVGLGEPRDARRGLVGRPVVNDDQLVLGALVLERGGDLHHRVGDGPLLVVRRDDDRQLHRAAASAVQRSTLWSWMSRSASSMPKVSR
jgi:hypothetical protein